MFQTKYCCQMSSFTKQRRVKDFVTMVIFWSIAIWFTSLSVSFCTKRVFCFGRKLWNSFDSTSTTYVQGQLWPNLALFWSASQTTHFYPTNLHIWHQHIWKPNILNIHTYTCIFEFVFCFKQTIVLFCISNYKVHCLYTYNTAQDSYVNVTMAILHLFTEHYFKNQILI